MIINRFKFVAVVYFLQLLVLVVHSSDDASIPRCTFCPGGEDITLPDKEILIPGYEYVRNCAALDSLLPTVFSSDSEDCQLLQSMGTLCGCPRQEDSCDLCASGSIARYRRRKLDFLAPMFNGVVPTCEMVEAGLHSYNSSHGFCASSQSFFGEFCGCDAQDDVIPELVEEEMCQLCTYGENVPFPDKKIGIVDFPFETCGQLANASIALAQDTPYNTPEQLAESKCFLFRSLSVHCGCQSPQSVDDICKMCVVDDSYEVPYPDRLVDESLTSVVLGQGGFQVSCGAMADIAQMFSSDPVSGIQQSVCRLMHAIGAEYCGCTPTVQKSTCKICSDPFPDDKLGMPLSNIPPFDLVTCRMAELITSVFEEGEKVAIGIDGSEIDFECRIWKFGGFLCGCNDGLFSYWGATTTRKQKAAIWIQRVAAILSICGSAAIIIDTIQRKLWSKLYNQIMLGLSFFDVLSSIAWGLGPLPTPQGLAQNAYEIDVASYFGGTDANFYGSHGNSQTCSVQGFILNWGFSSILYNVCLTYFYKLSIVNGLKDYQFTRTVRVLMLTIPALVGLLFASISQPFIKPTPVGCTFGTHNDKGGWTKIIMLFYLPYGAAFLYIPLTTIYIYLIVRKRTMKTKRRSLGGLSDGTNVSRMSNRSSEFSLKKFFARKKDTVESKVFWQSFWYVIAFYASYSVFYVAFALDGYLVDAYWFLVVVAVFAPLQGLFNSMVYFRKRLHKWKPLAKFRPCGHYFSSESDDFRRNRNVQRNVVPSALRAVQGDRGLSNIPSIFSSDRFSSRRNSTAFNRRMSDIPAINEHKEEEKEEIQEFPSQTDSRVSATTMATSGGIRSKPASSVSELSSSDRHYGITVSEIPEVDSEVFESKFDSHISVPANAVPTTDSLDDTPPAELERLEEQAKQGQGD